MNNLGGVWAGLSMGRKLIVVLATVGVFAAVLLLSRGAATRDMGLLYASLENGAAGDVITALEQRGVPYEVRGTAIWVPNAQRDELRLTLASEGLPANTGQGYELLDGLSGFGTTSQMFDAAYWRAKEGELARTILASPHIRAARVHISSPTNRPFQRESTVTAAVTVTTASGSLSGPQAQALRFLVASSVSGLLAENVAVIDGQGGLIDMADERGGSGQPLTAELRARAERLLEARVGAGNAIVEVSVDTVTESESIIERLIDPDSRVAISTEVEERTNSTTDTAGSDVTVASNLPTGDGAVGDGSSASEDAETRSVTNYEVSSTNREILRTPGAVRRLTVAVLVNDPVTTDPAGTQTVAPRDPAELIALSELVASAVGIDPERGDIITIRSMPFEPVQTLGTEAIEDAGAAPLNMMTLIQIAVLALVALILGLFVVRPILAANKAASLPPPAREDIGLIGSDTVAGRGAAVAGTMAEDDDFGPLPGLTAVGNAMIDDDDTVGMGRADDDPVSRLRRMIDERQDETIQILQSWIEEPEQTERA